MSANAQGIGWYERAYLALGIALSTTAVIPVFFGAQSGLVAGEDRISRGIWVAFYICLVPLAYHQRERLWASLRRTPLLAALLLWAIGSTAWSDAPSVTLKNATVLALTTLFGLYVDTRLSSRQMLNLVTLVLALLVGASVLVAILDPAHGLDYLRGDAWRGVFQTKNQLGRFAALALGIGLLRLLYDRRGRFIWAMLVCGSGLALVASHSRTSLAVIALVALVVVAIPALRADFVVTTAAAMFLILLACAIGYWLQTHADAVLTAFGADDTFTGRTAIWSAAWKVFEDRPLTGYGFDAFWRGWDGPSGVVWSAVGTTPPHAHNGFLDVLLALGLVGLALTCTALLRAVTGAWSLMRRATDVSELWQFPFLVFFVAANVTESSLVVRNSLLWIVFTAIAARTASNRRMRVPDGLVVNVRGVATVER
jgi:exopolysaccharide production protein ExoQ